MLPLCLDVREFPELIAQKEGLLAVNTTPLWVPLLIAALGVLGTAGGAIAGVVITQHRSDRREGVQWTRLREQERERWAREDTLRTFDQRRDSYIDFEEKLRSTALLVSQSQTRTGPSLETDWQLSVFQRLLRLRVFASQEGAETANDVYNALWRWGDMEDSYGDEGDAHNAEFVYDEACERFLAVMRRDLRIDLGTTTSSKP